MKAMAVNLSAFYAGGESVYDCRGLTSFIV